MDNIVLKNEPLRIVCWGDLIEKAAYEERRVEYMGQFITLKRGEQIASLRDLEERWLRWAVTKAFVRSFLNDLKNDTMIRITNPSYHVTLISIVNYDAYQSMEVVRGGGKNGTKNTTKRTTGAQPAHNQQTTPLESPYIDKTNLNKVKEGKGEVTHAHADAQTPAEEKPPSTPREGKYKFEGKVIRLTPKDFDQWAAAFPQVDLLPFLVERDAFLDAASPSAKSSWFLTTAKALVAENARLKRVAGLTSTKPEDPHAERKELEEETERERNRKGQEEINRYYDDVGLTDAIKRRYAEEDATREQRLAEYHASLERKNAAGEKREIPVVAMEKIPVPQPIRPREVKDGE